MIADVIQLGLSLRFRLITLLVLILPIAVFLAGATNGPALSEDERVLSEVLNDLAKYSGSDRPFSLGRKRPRKIYVLAIRPDSPPNPDRALDEFKGLVGIDDEHLRHAIGQVPVRYDRNENFSPRRLSGKLLRFLVSKPDLNNQSNLPSYMASFPMQLYLPGFSANGEIAVVHLYFPDLMHPSYGTYVLTKDHGDWQIAYREFATYL